MSRRDQLYRLLQTARLLPVLTSRARWRGLLVLNHHRIGDPAVSPLDRGVYSSSADALDEQLRVLGREADIVAPADIASVFDRPPGRYVLITFDDGYRDNYEAALPVLQVHGVRATFFVTTGFIGTTRLAWWDEIAWMIRGSARPHMAPGRWFDAPLPLGDAAEATIALALARYKTLPGSDGEAFLDDLAELTGTGRANAAAGESVWMTWDMVRAMHETGMEIGGHTVDHPVLARLPEVDQRREIAGSHERIAAEIGVAPTQFAYPVGGRDAIGAVTRRLVAEAGFAHAFSFYGGISRRAGDAFDIPRIYVAPNTVGPRLAALVAIPQVLGMEAPRLLRRR